MRRQHHACSRLAHHCSPGPLLAHIHISTFPRCPSPIVACLTYFPSCAHTKRSGRIHTTTPPPRCSSRRIPPYIHTSIHQPPHRRTPARPHIISAATNQTTLAPCSRSPYSPGNLSLSPVLLLFSPPPRARHQVALTSLGFARATQVACISSLSHFPCRPKTTSSCTRETRKRVAF